MTAVRALHLLVGVAALAAAGADLVAAGAVLGGARAGQDAVLVLVGALLVALGLAARRGRRAALVATGLVAAVAYTAALQATGAVVTARSLLDLVVLALAVWCLAITLRAGRRSTRPVGPHGVLAGGALLPAVVLVPLWSVALTGAWGAGRLPLAAALDLGITVPAGVLAASLLLRRRPGGLELATVVFVAEAAVMAVFTAGAAVRPGTSGDWIPTAALGALFAALAVGALRAETWSRPALPAEQVRLAA